MERVRLTIKVLSYNLNLLPKGVNPVGHRYKSARLKEFVKCIPDYDIIALQEVFATPWFGGHGCRQLELMRIAQECGFSCVRGEQPRFFDLATLRKTTDSGLLILSKYPIMKSGSFSFTHRGAHLDAGASKGVIYAQIKIGNSSLLVFNTHLQATHSSLASQYRGNYESIRYKQILELKNFINKQRHLAGRDVPWILTGDFNIDAISRPAVADEYGYVYDNTNIESEEYKKLLSLLDPTCRVRDLLKECNHGEHPATRPPRLEFPTSVDLLFKHKYPQRLDYIFWMEPESEKSSLMESKQPDHTLVVPFVVSGKEFSHLSDHYGIQTTLIYEGTKFDEESFLTEKVSAEDKQGLPKKSRWSNGWSVLWLVLGSCLILALIYPYCPLEVFCQVALFFLSYLVYKFHKIYRKFVKKREVAKELPDLKISKAIIGKYNPIKKEGPPHRSLHSPERLWDAIDEDATTLFENFRNAVRRFGYRPCLGTRTRNGDGSRGPYVWQTYDEVWTRVAHFGSGLINLGFKKGDLVGIFSENRAEWVIADQACNAYSLVSVPVYEAGEGYLKYILNHSQLSCVIASRVKTFQLLELAPECPHLKRIIQMEPIEYEEHYLAEQRNIKIIPFTFVEKDGIRQPHKHIPPIADDMATILYDMNTKGKIKGIMLSHRNLLSSSKALIYQGKSKLVLICDDVHISYFPLHMRVERSVLTLIFSVGASVGFCQEDNSKIFDDIQTLKPTIIFGVPGMFIRLYRKCKVIISSWWWPRRLLFQLAYKRKQKAHKKKRDTPFWNRILFRKFAARLGGRIRLIAIHSDGLLPLVHKEYLQIVTQCYLKTSVGVVSCSSMFSYCQDEQAGYPIPCNEIKLGDIQERGFTSRTKPERGRIHIRGYNLFMGYYKDEKLTKSKIDKDGWLATNDIGQWNDNGSLTILGHEKGILEPVKGEMVFNKHLEYLYLESSFVQQIFITCLPFRPLVAVVVPDHEVLYWWAKEMNIHHDFKPETLCRDPRVREAVLKDLEAVADQHMNLSAWEYIKAIYLEPKLFSVENQCITPTFNLRRHHLKERYSKEIMEMYRQLSGDPTVSLKNSLTLPTYTDTRKLPYLPTYQIDVHHKENPMSSPHEGSASNDSTSPSPSSSSSPRDSPSSSISPLPSSPLSSCPCSCACVSCNPAYFSSSYLPVSRSSSSLSTLPSSTFTSSLRPSLSSSSLSEVALPCACECPVCDSNNNPNPETAFAPSTRDGVAQQRKTETAPRTETSGLKQQQQQNLDQQTVIGPTYEDLGPIRMC